MSALLKDPGKPSSLMTELWYVAGIGDTKRLNELLNQGAEINAGDRSGVTALMRAAYHGQLPVVRALLEHGADPNVSDRSGLNALLMARHAGHLEIIETLEAHGAQGRMHGTGRPRMVGPTAEAGSSADNAEAAASAKTPQIRSLQAPPEIWELVHTTNEANIPFEIENRSSLTKPLMFAGVLTICAAAAIGFWYLRRSSSGDRPNQSVTARPTSTSQPPAAGTQAAAAAPTAASNPTTTTAGQVMSQPAAEADVTAATASTRSRKPIKPHSISTKTAPAFSFQKLENVSPDRNGNAQKPSRIEGNQAAGAAAVKRDAGKPQSQPTASTAKPTVPKPKVIAWP
jgi:Ankyrin repeats (3 copies)